MGPILVRHDGRRLDPRTAYRWVRAVGERAGLDRIHPHVLRAAFIMAALDAVVPLRDVQIAARHADPRTTTIYDRRRQNYDRLRRRRLRHQRLIPERVRSSGAPLGISIRHTAQGEPSMTLGDRRIRSSGSSRRPVWWHGYRGVVTARVVRRWTIEEFFRDAGPPTDDDVPIALDGRRLDTPDKVIAYIDEINRNRATAHRDG